MSSSCTPSPSPKCYFETLPVELHRIVLGLLPDFSSLRSTVVASRSAHDAYFLSSQSIQYSVFERLLSNSPQLSSESRWLLAASYLRRNDKIWRDNMYDFLAYSEPDVGKQHSPASSETATAQGLRFHVVVEGFSTAFLSTAMNLRQSRALRPRPENCGDIPLQYVEGIRIQRALYRFQRICQMYPRITPPSHPGAQTWGEHPLGDFVRRLPSWELEELRCIYRFLICKVGFLDEPAYSTSLGAPRPEEGFSGYRYKEHVVSMGLIFLHILLKAPFEARIALLKQYCAPSTRPVVLSDVLPLDGANGSVGCPLSSGSLKVQSLFNPGAGWMLYRPSIGDCGLTVLNELRDWGYCFWERDRLEAWGMYGRKKASSESGSSPGTEGSASDQADARTTSSATTNSPDRSSFENRARELGDRLQLWQRL
jgi:hypothetical protein